MLTRFGLGLVLALGLAGCHKSDTVTATAMDQNVDPANANMSSANESTQYSTAAPARVLGQNVQYQPQQQGEDYGQQGAPIERRGAYAGDPNYYDQQADNLEAEAIYQSDLTDDEANDPPPPLPYYDQPPAPEPDYLWTPGYWAWSPEGYYWVPGCWVRAPYTGALWTPGYWGFIGGRYRFHHGFWGLHIGFYGGIDYGFGYTGHGYYGGYWDNDHFRYNTAVNRVDDRVIRNVYVRNVVVNNVVVNNRIVNRTSYNGGRGGVDVRPLVAEAAVLHEQRHAPMASQIQVQREASQNRQQFYKQNQGRPQVFANARPVVADRAPSAVLPRAAGPAPQPGGRGDTRPGQVQGQGRSGMSQPGQPPLQTRPEQPGNRGVQPNAGGEVQTQPQRDQRGLRQGQPQPEVRQAQPQLDQRGARPVQPQVQAQPDQRGLRPSQPQPEMRQPTPQGRPQEQPRPQVQPQQQPRQQEQARPQPRQQEQPRPQPQPQQQPRQQEQARPQPRQQEQPRPQPQPQQQPRPQEQARPQPQQRPQEQARPQPQAAHQQQQENDKHGKPNH